MILQMLTKNPKRHPSVQPWDPRASRGIVKWVLSGLDPKNVEALGTIRNHGIHNFQKTFKARAEIPFPRFPASCDICNWRVSQLTSFSAPSALLWRVQTNQILVKSLEMNTGWSHFEKQRESITCSNFELKDRTQFEDLLFAFRIMSPNHRRLFDKPKARSRQRLSQVVNVLPLRIDLWALQSLSQRRCINSRSRMVTDLTLALNLPPGT